jgi:23S rRNA pseudouridine1911/1915/1917 synthase
MATDREFANLKRLSIVIPEGIEKTRLDKYIGQSPEFALSRSRLQKLLEENLVTINGCPARGKMIISGGEKIEILIPPEPETKLVAEEIALDIVYEDDFLLVVNKPAGMAVHPSAGNYTGTLVHALLHYTKSLSSGAAGRPGIVHRLDKDTSGLVMVAKDDQVHQSLQDMLKERQIIKKYNAVVCGHMKENEGTIDLPVGRSLKDRKKMAVTHVKSREAVTEYKLIERYGLYDYLEINLRTGRTHQIRVHFAHVGHPVLGDADYGGREKWHRGVFSNDRRIGQRALAIMTRQALHALRLEFKHPVDGRKLNVEAPLPADLAELLEFLKTENG